MRERFFMLKSQKREELKDKQTIENNKNISDKRNARCQQLLSMILQLNITNKYNKNHK